MDSSKRDTSSYTTASPHEKQESGPESVVPTTEGSQPSGSKEAPPSSNPVDPNGRVIRGYRLLERLGSGAFGVVYKALSSGGVEVAIKEIRYSLDHPQSKRELDALELIKRLRHPYLLPLHDFWIENDRLYIVMELADSTLSSLAKKGTTETSQAELVRIFGEAAEALDFLHQHHVLHRDIKPANILLLRGHTKVADLGLAKFNPEEVATSMNLAGTPAYMPPETFGNEFRAESDQYALALCYAELRLGRRLCDGTNYATVVLWHVSGTPQLEGLEPHEEQAVRQALSKKPTDRFRSCQDFVRALEEPKPPPPKSNRTIISVVALFTLAVLIVLGWKVLQPPTPWLPKDFFAPAGAEIKREGDKAYYNRIAKLVGEEEVEFLLIPHKETDEQTFYIMKNKVSNRLFKVAAEDEKFKKLLEEQREKFPSLEWDQWRKGARANDMDLGCEDRFPVLRVNVMEADCFARWLGGKLPQIQQWEVAGGKTKGVKGSYLAQLLKPGDIAIGREAEGPMPIGEAAEDKSPFGCTDMAGNGEEWTRNLSDGSLIPPPILKGTPLVTVLGKSYFDSEPYKLGEKDYKYFTKSYPWVGFRVVVEPP